jgi:hypothetical protein
MHIERGEVQEETSLWLLVFKRPASD